MKRKLFAVLTVAGLSAFIALAGCGSDAGTGNSTPVNDAGATDTGKGDTKTDTTIKKDTAVKPDPCASCDKATQVCKDEKCVDKPCKDGCKAGQICKAEANAGKGECIDPACALPTKWGPNLAKLSMLNISDADKGCDLNDDAKPDNALGALKDLAGSQLTEAVEKGSVVIILEPTEYKTDGTKFGLDLLIGDVDDGNKDCDVTKATCNYTVTPKNWDQTVSATTCPAVVNFPKTTIKDGKMAAGGKDQVFDLKIPVTAGIEIEIKITQAQVRGDTADDKTWMSTKNGQICGVITKEALSAALDAVPEETLKDIGGKSAVQNILNNLLTPDIDTDGDDEADAISVALDFETIPANIVGLSKESTET